jgi:hypothetical protein
MFAGVMPVCVTHKSESLRQVHAAFTVFDPGFKYAEIERTFKYGYAQGCNAIKFVTDRGTSDDRFIAGCQFASDPELPAKEVNTLTLLSILNRNHEITAEDGASAGFVLLFTVNGTRYRFRHTKSLVTAVMKKCCQLMLNASIFIKYDDPWLSHERSFSTLTLQAANVIKNSRVNVHDNLYNQPFLRIF